MKIVSNLDASVVMSVQFIYFKSCLPDSACGQEVLKFSHLEVSEVIQN